MKTENEMDEFLFGSKKSNTPREFTNDEVKEKFVKHILNLIDYWENESRKESVHEKLSGLAFSILTTIDGESGGIPGFKIIPSPHKSDKEYLKSRGFNWYPYTENLPHDIGGSLHEDFCNLEKSK